MPQHLFDPALLDQLEGLNERYASLSRRLEQVRDQAASFDQLPDPGQISTLEALRQRVREEAAALLKEIFDALAG